MKNMKNIVQNQREILQNELFPRIFGKLVDGQGRCEHYHTVRDIVANRCSVCGKFYACYKCHDELENHAFGAVDENESETVMCGVCHMLFSYKTYSALSKCSQCGSEFNPRCSLHKPCYAR